MNMTLRGHHLLCVHGFRGMGYSPKFVERMWEIVEQIRNDEADFAIRVVAALDDSCSACPHNGGTVCLASQNANEHVLSMDHKVLHKLGLRDGNTYTKSERVRLVATLVEPDDLDQLCEGCSWLRYGVCKEGITELRKRYSDDQTTEIKPL